MDEKKEIHFRNRIRREDSKHKREEALFIMEVYGMLETLGVANERDKSKCGELIRRVIDPSQSVPVLDHQPKVEDGAYEKWINYK